MANITDIKADRMRYTKNKLSANLAYFAIIFNAIYFVSVYNTDVGSFYYNIEIGFSVIVNLLFMLFTFLASESVKNYSKGFSIFLTVIGAMQIVRIFGIPTKAHDATVSLDGVQKVVMDDKQFTTLCIFLIISAACCIAAGVIGLVKTITLENYKKETGLR